MTASWILSLYGLVFVAGLSTAHAISVPDFNGLLGRYRLRSENLTSDPVPMKNEGSSQYCPTNLLLEAGKRDRVWAPSATDFILDLRDGDSGSSLAIFSSPWHNIDGAIKNGKEHSVSIGITDYAVVRSRNKHGRLTLRYWNIRCKGLILFWVPWCQSIRNKPSHMSLEKDANTLEIKVGLSQSLQEGWMEHRCVYEKL